MRLYTWEVTVVRPFYTPLSAREYSEMKLKYPPNWIITCSERGGNNGKQTLADFVYFKEISYEFFVECSFDKH